MVNLFTDKNGDLATKIQAALQIDDATAKRIASQIVGNFCHGQTRGMIISEQELFARARRISNTKT